MFPVVLALCFILKPIAVLCFILAVSLQPNMSMALERVNAGDIALVWETAVLDYFVSTQAEETCRLKSVSVALGEFYYAFALKKNSPFTGENSIMNKCIMVKC